MHLIYMSFYWGKRQKIEIFNLFYLKTPTLFCFLFSFFFFKKLLLFFVFRRTHPFPLLYFNNMQLCEDTILSLEILLQILLS